MFRGKFIMPGILNRFLMILHITISNNSQTFSFQFISPDGNSFNNLFQLLIYLLSQILCRMSREMKSVI